MDVVQMRAAGISRPDIDALEAQPGNPLAGLLDR